MGRSGIGSLLSSKRRNIARDAALAAVLASTACEGGPGEQIEVVLEASPSGGIGDGVEKVVKVGERAGIDVRFNPPGGLVELTIDCAPPEQTDVVGFHFSVDAPAFATVRQTAPRAGYLVLRDALPASLTVVHVEAEAGPATCAIRVVPASHTCGPRMAYRSIEVDHDHVAPGPEPRAGWETFPSSGDHYPIWAGWDQFYVRPIRTGYLLHDLEHGGIVLSYACAAPSGSDRCVAAANGLLSAKTRFAQRRTNVTPDPSQPLLIGARAWRWAYAGTCYDEAEMLDFMARRFRHGREDIDDDAQPPFDPTL